MELRWGEMFQEDELLRMREKKRTRAHWEAQAVNKCASYTPRAKMSLGAPVTT